MASAIVCALVLTLLLGVIALLRWEFALFASRRSEIAQADEPQSREDQAFFPAVHAVRPGGLLLFGDNLPRNRLGVARITREQRAEAFLQRILELTGATKVDGAYILNVGKVQFQLRDRFIRRVLNPKDPKSPYEETCFYLVHNGMPKVEEIATALLHLSNNPSLFDKWALQNGVAFKADGKVFDRCPLMGLR